MKTQAVLAAAVAAAAVASAGVADAQPEFVRLSPEQLLAAQQAALQRLAARRAFPPPVFGTGAFGPAAGAGFLPGPRERLARMMRRLPALDEPAQGDERLPVEPWEPRGLPPQVRHAMDVAVEHAPWSAERSHPCGRPGEAPPNLDDAHMRLEDDDLGRLDELTIHLPDWSTAENTEAEVDDSGLVTVRAYVELCMESAPVAMDERVDHDREGIRETVVREKRVTETVSKGFALPPSMRGHHHRLRRSFDEPTHTMRLLLVDEDTAREENKGHEHIKGVPETIRDLFDRAAEAEATLERMGLGKAPAAQEQEQQEEEPPAPVQDEVEGTDLPPPPAAHDGEAEEEPEAVQHEYAPPPPGVDHSTAVAAGLAPPADLPGDNGTDDAAPPAGDDAEAVPPADPSTGDAYVPEEAEDVGGPGAGSGAPSEPSMEVHEAEGEAVQYDEASGASSASDSASASASASASGPFSSGDDLATIAEKARNMVEAELLP